MASTRLSLLVALHSGSLSGVDTYAEQIAATAADRGHRVTILVVGGQTGRDVEHRLARSNVRVLSTADASTGRLARMSRRLPTLALAEMRALMSETLLRSGARFDVAHLNHPALSPAARPFANRVVTAAWFYPHRAGARISETWRHTGRRFPKSAALAVKGLGHYLNDRSGYAGCNVAAAPTERLAAQLRDMRIPAVACPPPAEAPAPNAADEHPGVPGGWRVTICCGDLAHPRKNVRSGVEAVAHLARLGRPIELVLVGGNADTLASTLAPLPQSVSVRKTGRLARDESRSWTAASDLLLVPSLYEEWGYVATEALMAGTPVAAFPVYPFDEVLVPPLGACADDMTPRALAQAAARSLEGGGNRSVVRQAAGDRFGAEVVGRRLNDLWTVGDVPRVELATAAGNTVLN